MLGHAIVIDFDGTICEHRYPHVGELKPGVRDALREFKKLGLRIVIHSVRTASYMCDDDDPELSQEAQEELIRKFMAEHDLPFDDVCLFDKPLAVAYIDDRAYRYEDNWAELAQRLRREILGCTSSRSE